MQSRPKKSQNGSSTRKNSRSQGTQADLAYKELSHRIVIGEIAPNDRITEQFWARKLSVNRAAIRETLTRLLGEGLVRRGERGGFFVAEMSEAELHELRELREILETGAFSLACDKATAREIREIEEACNDFAHFVEKSYYTGAHEADLRFHLLLMKASGNARLAELYQRSHIPLFQRKRAPATIDLEEFLQTEKEHRLIVEALRKKDKRLGIQHLRNHFNRGERDALA
ncbi:MAG TPA: GntR family transcriptional regulator [Verrucomicrobiota bacterium]|nr:GntR family transcriptional regulator [Verrucomicrobiota bacterium]